MTDERARAQWERAHGAWELLVHERPEPGDPRFTALRRTLRVKSFEAQALLDKLPGPVRRGARIDLEPLLERLQPLGLRVSLEPRGGIAAPPRD
jgi:hypothetical protein